MKCPYCRKQIADHVHFCPYCGKSLGNNPLLRTRRGPQSRRRRKNRSHRGILIVLLLILILFLGAEAFLFLTGRIAVWQNARGFAQALNAGDLEKLDALADAACSAYRSRSSENLPADSHDEGDTGAGFGTEMASGSGKSAANAAGASKVEIPEEYRSALERVYEVRTSDAEAGENGEPAKADANGEPAEADESRETTESGESGENVSLLDMVLGQDKVHVAYMTMNQVVLTVESPDLSGLYEDETLYENLKEANTEEVLAEYVRNAPRRKTRVKVPYLPGRGKAAIDDSVKELTDALNGGHYSATEQMYGQIMDKLMESGS